MPREDEAGRRFAGTRLLTSSMHFLERKPAKSAELDFRRDEQIRKNVAAKGLDRGSWWKTSPQRTRRLNKGTRRKNQHRGDGALSGEMFSRKETCGPPTTWEENKWGTSRLSAGLPPAFSYAGIMASARMPIMFRLHPTPAGVGAATIKDPD